MLIIATTGKMLMKVPPDMKTPSRAGLRLYKRCPTTPPTMLPIAHPMPNAKSTLVAATTPMPFSWAMKSLKYEMSTPHGIQPGIACKNTIWLVWIRHSLQNLLQLIFSEYWKPCCCSKRFARACSAPPRGGSRVVQYMIRAMSIVGTATITKGNRQLYLEPTNPDNACPSNWPIPIAMPGTVATSLRWPTAKRSPKIEKTSGVAPPIEIPVSIRSTKSCQ
mmetsp:Transcript_21800/g.41615  ORF Transcript_21800/g.41615 Transcript_21800/m.41615 type:complete len:220 (-) Transcript_21800:675-1334(-)